MQIEYNKVPTKVSIKDIKIRKNLEFLIQREKLIIDY